MTIKDTELDALRREIDEIDARILEAIVARSLGMEILGLSLVTNAAAGMTGEPLNHEEVLAAGQAAATRMGDLLSKVIRAL